MVKINKEEIERYRFDTFSGHFVVDSIGWVHIKDPQGNRVILHKDQILAMSEFLSELAEAPKEVNND